MTVRFELGGDEHCSACGRWVYADGGSIVIELAKNDKDPGDVDAYFESIDANRMADIHARFEYLSIYGTLEPRRELQYLDDDIWEITTAEDRILFFYREAASSHRLTTRITNCCEKSVSKTQQGKLPVKHIRRAVAIKREDAEHDSD